MIILRPFPEEKFTHWLNQQKETYILERMRANHLSSKEAEAIANEQLAKVLPQGMHSPLQFFHEIVWKNAAVGSLWWAIQGEEPNRQAFLYDIIIDEKYRGQGIGRQAMELLELEVKKRGLKRLGLHVFNHNRIAVKLYQKLGYQPTDMVMEKSLEKEAGV